MQTNYTSTHSTSSTTRTTYTTNTKQEDETKKSTLFNELKNEKTNPRDITYDEYKNLKREDIDKLYPKDTMAEQNKEALSLHIKANMADDEVLNKVLFEKELESLSSIDAEYLKPANDIINAIFEATSHFAHNIMRLEAINKHFESFGVKKGTTLQEYSFEFSKTMEITVGNITRSVSYNKSVDYTKQTGLSTTDVFSAFDTMSNKFKTTIQEHHYGKDSHFYKGTQIIQSYHENIKAEYNKRMEVNTSTLYAYTKSYSYSNLDYKQNMDNNPQNVHLDSLIEQILSFEKSQNNQYLSVEDIRQKYKDNFNDEKYSELLEKVGLEDLSDEEKELFKSVIDDKHISDSEVRNLSYEQMKTLNKIIMQSDDKDNYLAQDIIDIDYKASRLLDTTFMSKDDTFNKTVFQQVKGLHNDEVIYMYMAMVSGTRNFPNEDSIYKNSDDPAEVLKSLIQTNEQRQSIASQSSLKGYFNASVNIYNNILQNYENNIAKEKEK